MLSLPDNRIRRLEELRGLAGREIHFVVHAVDWATQHPYMDTDAFTWIVGPIVCARTLPTPDSRLPHYTDKINSKTVWCLHATDVIADAPEVRAVRMADYNCVRKGGPRYPYQAVFRTAKEAEMWRIMLKLSMDDPCPVEQRNAMQQDSNRTIFRFERYHVLQAMRNWLKAA